MSIEDSIRTLVSEAISVSLPVVVAREVENILTERRDKESAQKGLLNVREAAQFLGVEPRTIWRWARDDESFPVRMAGSELRFDEAELKDWTRLCAKRTRGTRELQRGQKKPQPQAT